MTDLDTDPDIDPDARRGLPPLPGDPLLHPGGPVPATPSANRKARPKGDAPPSLAQQLVAEEQRRCDQHRVRSDELEHELVKDEPDVGADQRLLLRLAARETALLEDLQRVQIALIMRVEMAVDEPQLAQKLAKAAKESAVVSSSLSSRVEALLGTASSLRIQRHLSAERPPHLRVA